MKTLLNTIASIVDGSVSLVVSPVRSAGGVLSQVWHFNTILQDLLCGLHSRYVHGQGIVYKGGWGAKYYRMWSVIDVDKLWEIPALSWVLAGHDLVCGVSLLSVSPVSVRHRPAHHLRGPGRDADGSAGLALPGALHSAHQPHCSAVAQGVATVLDWKWICGEYQFDMTAYRRRTKNPQKNKQQKKTQKTSS